MVCSYRDAVELAIRRNELMNVVEGWSDKRMNGPAESGVTEFEGSEVRGGKDRRQVDVSEGKNGMAGASSNEGP